MKTKQARKKTKKRNPEIRWMIEDENGFLLELTFLQKQEAKDHLTYRRWRGCTPVKVEIKKVKP